MRAIVANRKFSHGLGVAQVPDLKPLPNEVVIRVQTISLNPGEVRRAVNDAPADWVPGWDFAGVVEQAASVGETPVAGQRVVGFLEEGAWRERVATPPRNLAVLPDDVSMSAAATLPVAGLTARAILAEGGLLTGKTVLVNGASGGVGHFALQLARASGATVVAAVRQDAQRDNAEADGAHRVVISKELKEVLETQDKFDLILESAGGAALANALQLLSSGGVCVSFGNSSGASTTFNPMTFFYPRGRARLVGFYLLATLKRDPPSEGLGSLTRLVSSKVLRPRIAVEAPWSEVGQVADRFLKREISGKAVLHVE